MAEDMIPRALTIAGSDSSGGAGIQADLKVFNSMGVYGMSAITALTAQNTMGVRRVDVMEKEMVQAQIDACLEDIGADSVKTGMLANSQLVKIVRERISYYQVKNLVIDPVMISKTGVYLLEEEARNSLKEELLPLSHIITPNIFEAEELTGLKVKTLAEMADAARALHELGASWVVIKGGHLKGDPLDLVYNGKEFFELTGKRVVTKNTHGTGCSYSAAITAGLAQGLAPMEAIKQAKKFIEWGIANSHEVGSGYGPTNHFYYRIGGE